MKKMKILLATTKDISLLAEMNYQLIKDEGHSNSMSVPELRNRMEFWLQDDYIAALINIESKVAGYALWRNAEEYLYIRQFFVQPVFRKKQVGANAINLLKKSHWHGRLLRLEVLVNNHRGYSFWQSVGFENYCLTMEYKNE